jgi:ABC-type polysaccharide transport system permease subunit
MPLNIPSVDLTRSQGDDGGDLTARNTLTYNTQRIITMATVSTAESMAPEDAKKRSMVRSQRIFGIELPLMLFFMVILIIGIIGAMPLWIGFFTSH